jgi:hypothetical protein
VLPTQGEVPSEAELLAVIRGADVGKAQAAFQMLWRRHENQVSQFVAANAPHDLIVPLKRNAVFGALRAKWLHRSEA